jgi:signal transduction histidine kinase
MINENEWRQLEEISKNNPEIGCLISKIIEEYKLNICKFSHELRNPITLINSSLQLIESQHPEVKGFKFWNETMSDVRYVGSLLDELSNYTKSNTMNFSEYSISDLLNSICCAVCNDIALSNGIFTLNYSQALPNMIGDSLKIREVLMNLLKNAKDSLSSDNGSIYLNAYCLDNDTLQIEIGDNGCGIPIEHQETIFEPFVTFKENGTGLGLSLAKKIIEAHHGTIKLESQINKGTTFYIVLPINPQT